MLRRRCHAPASGERTIHVVGAFDRIGSSEHRAYGLYTLLSARAPVRLWSTVPPPPEALDRLPIVTIDAARGHYPKDGHFVFLGVCFDWGAWLERSRPQRVTICYNTASAEELVARLVALEDLEPGFALDLSFPSATFRDTCELPGAVEYPPIDVARFRPRCPQVGGVRPLAIGRHSRDARLKFHPNDPAFFRTLTAEGHRVRVLGGTCLARALAPEVEAGSIALEPEARDVVPFLDGLDVFVYRVHPEGHEAGGTVIMEAMAMELPVIVFADRVCGAELIAHGRSGFLVASESEALAVIRELRRDPELRHSIGTVARATLVATMAAQPESQRNFYLPGHDERAE
jgi:hypothetical protein